MNDNDKNYGRIPPMGYVKILAGALFLLSPLIIVLTIAWVGQR